MQIPDLSARQKALDPSDSYIVQAPAGSGKTELLTQRFLKLLACVDAPESIIALTFTKKAAAEMRERILSALEKVANNEKNSQPQTDKLAKDVLECDKKHKWHLRQAPHRLRIQTIDALCAELVGKMPLLSKGIPYTTIEKEASPYYKEAAERCLLEGMQENVYQTSIETLLLHLGNNYSRTISLLAEMLNWREQWLPLIGYTHTFSSSKCKQILEQGLKHLHEDAIIQLEAIFTQDIKEELQALCDYAEGNLPFSPEQNDFWQKVITLLLTKENTWRSRIDKSIGFPSDTETKNKEEKERFKMMKQRLNAVLSHYRESPEKTEECRLALENYRRLPPLLYSDTQWKILEALITLLPLLAAQLKTVFMETGKTDFTEISEQASAALGSSDEPTDLALYCDYAIKHLLIDEFQDTSFKQFRFLEKLTQGWEPGDGRTLFVVGDPMQSIYRFREANVSLFLKARDSGIGSIALQSLTLVSNFRSHPNLITWVNQCFKTIFPTEDNLHLGAVKHHSSEPGRENYAYQSNIQFYRNETAEVQGKCVVDIVKMIPSNESIGLLVSSRKKLKNILPYLQEANIAYQGIDIDLLANRTYIQDLCSLTQTLLEPANQLAWYAVLRAPWCGLTLADLWALSQENQLLSPDGQKHFQQVQAIIVNARQERQRSTLSLWVETTWRTLGGHLYVNTETQKDIEMFWSLLDDCSYEQYNLMDSLLEKVKALYSNISKESNVHIMTIHKSKGLEFDHVILPHLEAGSSPQDTPLLQHMERKTSRGENNFLLAAYKSIEKTEDPTYQYLKYINNKKESFERQRLLYVALTRARSHLHLMEVQESSKSPSKNSFLYALIPHLPNETSQNNEINLAPITSTSPTLARFSSEHFDNAEKECPLISVRENKLPSFPNFNISLMQLIGTFIHEHIQYCAENRLTSAPLLELRHCQHRLIELGVYPLHEQIQAVEYCQKALNNLYQDPRGQWILNVHHQDSHNEYPINYYDVNQKLQTAILDRTFIDTATQVQWIIDYKITQDCSLSSEVPQQYRTQLEHYGRLLRQNLKNRPLRKLDNFAISSRNEPFENRSLQDVNEDLKKMNDEEIIQKSQFPKGSNEVTTAPIHLGLYYPLTQTWIEWVCPL